MATAASNTSEFRFFSPIRLANAVFVPTGIVTTFLGPMLPDLSSRWGLTDARAGFFFTAQFVGSILGVLLSGVIVARRGFRASLISGLFLMSIGTAMLLSANWTVGVLAVFACGVGLGVAIPASNLLVAQSDPSRSAANLNLLNLSWGAGAVSCPFLVAAFHKHNAIASLFYSLTVLLSAMILVVRFALPAPAPERISSNPRSNCYWRNRKLVALALLFFLYVGTEAAIGGWVASYAQRFGTSEAAFWVFTPAFFWGSLLLGRATAPFVLRFAGEVTLARLHLLLAFVGIALLIDSHNNATLVAGTTGCGLGLSAVFPLIIARVGHVFGSDSHRPASLLFALAGLGGACPPWLVGYTSSHLSSLRTGLWIPLGSCALMLAIYFTFSPQAARLNDETV